MAGDSTEAQRPEPLTPDDCNLQNFKFMPVDVQRLMKSDTWVMATDAEKVAAIGLWFESWHQVPAASLPEADRIRGHLSQSKSWARVREQAMRGWLLCSDGRYYHPVVAEKALEAWIEKLLAQVNGGAGNAKRWGLHFDATTVLHKLQDAIRRLQHLAPHSDTLKKKAVAAALAGIAPGSPPDPPNYRPPTKKGSPPDSPPDSLSDRNRQGQGSKKKTPPSGPPLPKPAPAPPAAPSPTPRKRPAKASTALAVVDAGPVLTGLEQRSPTPLKACPKSFIATEQLVQDALGKCPLLNREDLQREHRKFLAHRFKTGRIEWATTWLVWMETENQRREERDRGRGGAGGGTYLTRREAQVLEAVPGLASLHPSYVPNPGALESDHDRNRTVDAEEVERERIRTQTGD